MHNLATSGLNLRSITPKEYGQLIEDLNYNFTQILQLPGFKGRQGDTVEGPPGIGIRGSKWIFVTLESMTETYNVTVTSQVTLSFINSVFNDNPTQFFESLYIPGGNQLLVGDILVLPSGQLIEFAEVDDGLGGTEIEFIDTGITFAQVSSITEDQVKQIFYSLFNAGQSSDGAFRMFNAVAKNNTDESPALNQNQNNDSVIDIVVPGAGPGAPLANRKFAGVAESNVDENTMLCLIAGSVTRYHKLIQETQRIHTNDYAPGIDDFAAQVILQNSYKNGIIFGHRGSETIRQFGRLYRSTNATILTSSYSPNDSEFSDIKLFDNKIILRAINATIDAPTAEVLSATYNSRFFSYSGNTARLAEAANSILRIYAPQGTYLEYVKNAQILSTNTNGRIVASYSILNAMPNTPNNSQLLSALAIRNYMSDITVALQDHETRITALEGGDTSIFFAKQNYITVTTNLNTLTAYGTYTIQAGVQLSNFIPSLNIAPSDITINVFLSKTSGSRISGLQEMSWISANSGSYAQSQKWIRDFSINGSNQTWSQWSKLVASGDEPTADAPILVEGTFAQNNLKVKHATSPAVSSNNIPLGAQYIKNIQVDNYGHITGITSEPIEFPTQILSHKSYVSSWARDRKYTHSPGLPGSHNIIACIITLRCVQADSGYSYGDIATVETPSRDGNTDHGIGVRWREAGNSTVDVMVGDYVRVRGLGGSPTTQNNPIDPIPARWHIQLTWLYTLTNLNLQG